MVDYNNIKVNWNYFLDHHSYWFKFGETKDWCDLSDNKKDVFCKLPHEIADKIIALRHKFINDLYELIYDLDEYPLC